MKRISCIFLFFPLFIFSQQTITGVIKNAKTKEILPFTNITTSENKLYHSNIYGLFEFPSPNKVKEFTVSYVGFQSKKVKIEAHSHFYEILLEPKTETLNEVVIQASENESVLLVKKIIANESKNNWVKIFTNFSYDAYNKTLITANPDSISSKIDTIFKIENGKRVLKKIDSSSFKLKNILDKRHLYISEKVSNYQFKKGDETKETVIAVRMAGFKQPLYEMLALNFSDFNIYEENYVIAGTKYINPITEKGLKEYRFKILDTLKNAYGNAFMLYFKPKRVAENAGLEGVLFVDTNNFAVTKAILELKGIVYVKLTQDFDFDATLNNWYPIEKELIISKGDSNKNISLFGGMVKFQQDKNNKDSLRLNAKSPSDFIHFTSKTTNSNFITNNIKPKPLFAEKITISENAHLKTEDFWNQYRTDSITTKDQVTFQIIDSIAQNNKIEHKIEVARELLKGYYPTKYFKFNIAKILTLNNHEGLRIGIGGETNRTISERFKLSGYLAYGTKDNDLKFQYGASVRLNKYHNTWLGVNYTNDLKEAAALDFMLDNTSFSLINPRNLNISDFYHYKTISAQLIHDILPQLESSLKFSAGEYNTVFDYAYVHQTELKTAYHLTDLSVGFLYSPFSEYMRTPMGKRKITSGYTDFLFQATQSFEGIFDGEFDFTQFIFRANHRVSFRKNNYLYLLLQGGLVLGDAPLTHLFNATPNYTLKNPWIKRITFGGKNSFETMQYNEFISDRYVMFQVHQQLQKFNLGKFKPQVTIISRAAIGSISHPENHQLIQFNSMEKGYFESGVEMNNLFKGLGFSTFYRYGAYHHQKISDNLAVKITYRLMLGL